MRIIEDIKLPGISFETVPPELAEPLPPMDIAAFVGFAASGPLHTPVAVEDVVRFREIFGDDLPLVWDSERGAWQYAHLGPAVRDFFRNGGQRCWVVRVAEPYPPAQFQLPFLLARVNGVYQGARAEARSQGTWADALQLNTTLQRTLLVDAAWEVTLESIHILLGNISREAVQSGDLLLIEFPDIRSQLFVKADKDKIISPQPLREEDLPGALTEATGPSSSYIVVDTKSPFYFKETVALQDGLENYVARLLTKGTQTTFPVLDPDALEENLLSPMETPEAQTLFRIAVELPAAAEAPLPGDILELTHTSDGSSYFMPVIKTEIHQTGAIDGSPPEAGIAILSAGGLLQVLGEEDLLADVIASPSLSLAPIINRLNFEIRVSREEELLVRLAELGFSPAHERYWGKLPSDEQLYRLPVFGEPEQNSELPVSSLAAEAAHPRFPIAFPGNAKGNIEVFLPVGMPLRALDTARKGVIEDTSPEKRLLRNGLQSFAAGLFLDEALSDSTLAALDIEFFHRRYIQKRKLRGLYTLYEIEEVSIISVPDAAHRPWRQTRIEEHFLDSPQELAATLEGTTLRLDWEMPGFENLNVTEFEWQQSEDPAFEQAKTFSAGKNLRAEKEIQFGCPKVGWFRVRALRQAEKGPWSNAVRLLIPKPFFEKCHEIIPTAPELHLPEIRNNQILLSWSVVSDAVAYELQRSALPGGAAFEGAVNVYWGEDMEYREYFPGNQTLWFRVRAMYEGNLPGPWSQTRRTGSGIKTIDALYSAEDYRDETFFDYQNPRLLAIHRALLRFCAARADIFAVLSLPAHFRSDEVLNYKSNLVPDGSNRAFRENLQAGVLPISFGEIRATSYGALIHPWLVIQNESVPSLSGDIPFRHSPPDGTVCGNIARVSRREGAWIAPAYDPAEGTLSLTPVLESSRIPALFGAQVNVFRQEVEGFLLLSAFTLYPDRELRQINVRRLLILLRKIAVREGDVSVFQPNDLSFRREMQRRFEGILNDLYLRGAFSGAQPEQAYQVAADDSINTRQSIDAGRFIMELRVAPSRPMMFITVRLVQSSEGLVTEEVVA